MSEKEMKDRILLRMDEAASACGVSRSKLYVLAASGQLPGLVKFGGSLRVSRRVLEAWIEEQATGSAWQGITATPAEEGH